MAKENDAVTLSDVDRFLFENFKSLYLEECEEGITRRKTTPFPLEPPPPENLCSSSRFFVESGSSSSRITEEPFSASASSSATSESSTPASDGSLAPEDFVALMTYSPSPYDDFRRSMQEMVEVRVKHNGKVDWAFLEELLFWYLDLNNKKSYRHILRAFVDITVGLRESSGKSPAIPQSFSEGGLIEGGDF